MRYARSSTYETLYEGESREGESSAISAKPTSTVGALSQREPSSRRRKSPARKLQAQVARCGDAKRKRARDVDEESEPSVPSEPSRRAKPPQTRAAAAAAAARVRPAPDLAARRRAGGGEQQQQQQRGGEAKKKKIVDSESPPSDTVMPQDGQAARSKGWGLAEDEDGTAAAAPPPGVGDEPAGARRDDAEQLSDFDSDEYEANCVRRWAAAARGGGRAHPARGGERARAERRAKKRAALQRKYEMEEANELAETQRLQDELRAHCAAAAGGGGGGGRAGPARAARAHQAQAREALRQVQQEVANPQRGAGRRQRPVARPTRAPEHGRYVGRSVDPIQAELEATMARLNELKEANANEAAEAAGRGRAPLASQLRSRGAQLRAAAEMVDAGDLEKARALLGELEAEAPPQKPPTPPQKPPTPPPRVVPELAVPAAPSRGVRRGRRERERGVARGSA